MVTRRFELVGGGSAKFWEVSTSGSEMMVCFGRIGTDGQSKTKRFPSSAAALQAAQKLIAEKTKKGYAEVQADASGGDVGLTAEQWWKRLEVSGWCSDVPASEVSRIRREFKKHGPDLSSAFSVLARDGFDAECIENDGDYSKYIVAAYRSASHGAFKPEKVKDHLDYDEETAEVSFEVNGTAFRKQFEQMDDYVAEDFHAFMNGVVAKLGEKRRFFTLPTEDQIASLVFVTPATFKRAQRLGLIPETDEDEF